VRNAASAFLTKSRPVGGPCESPNRAEWSIGLSPITGRVQGLHREVPGFIRRPSDDFAIGAAPTSPRAAAVQLFAGSLLREKREESIRPGAGDLVRRARTLWWFGAHLCFLLEPLLELLDDDIDLIVEAEVGHLSRHLV
jgi:hypothetical protein